MSTRKDFRIVKFEVKHHNEKPVMLWAEVPKKAFTEGKVKPNNYVEFGGDEKMVENSFCKKECLYF